MNQPRHNPGFSRRQLLKYSGLGALPSGEAASSPPAAVTTATGRRGGQQQQSGGLLIHGATGGGSKDTLDPHAPVTAADIARCNNLFEPLLFWNNDYELEPALAESLEASADAITWTITMRQGVTFHNGQPVTADDAWISIQRVADPDKPLSAGGQLSQIIDFQSTKVVDETTLRWCSTRPTRSSTRCWRSTPSASSRAASSTPPTRSAPAPSRTSPSRPARPAPSPSTPTTGATPAFVDELQIQDFADDNAKVNALQANQIQTLDNLPYNLSTRSRAPAAAC